MAFPATSIDITVELYLNGAWVDITTDVLVRDGITISRGRSDWGEHVDASRCQLTINNGSGNYSPRNPLGTHYGHIGRNTPIRMWINEQGVTPARFSGEVSEWPVRWDPSGNDVFVPIEAYGILRRLANGAIPLRSAMYRTLYQLGAVQPPVAYWPCEDGSQASTLWSAIPTHRPWTLSGDVNPGGFSDLASSDPIAVFNDGSLGYVNVRAYDTSAGEVTATFLVHIPPADGLEVDGSHLLTLESTGPGAVWRVQANLDRTVRLQLADDQFVVITTSGNSTFSIADAGALVTLRLTQNGADVDWRISVYNVDATDGEHHSGTFTGTSFDRVRRVVFGAQRNLHAVALGHVGLFTGTLDDAVLIGAVNAYDGETAGRRIERLCQQEEIPLGVVGEVSDLDDTQRLGPQRSNTTVDLLFASSDADGGILYEPARVERSIGTFEDGTTQGWSATGATPPTLAASTVQAHTGTYSLEITWPGGASSKEVQQGSNEEVFIPGVTYTWTVWVYVPTGSEPVRLGVSDASGPTSSLNDTWEELTHTFEAIDPNGRLVITPANPTTAGDKAYVDDLLVTTDRAGLAVRSLRSLYGDAVTMALDYTAGEVAPPLEPVDDDQLVVNDVEVTREGASPIRVEVDTGALSTQEPPDGVGRYRGGGTFNVETDEDAEQLAAWIAHLGTWDEQRYPRITVDLKRNPTRIPDATSVDIGDRITITNAPAWLPPELIDQQVQGYTEEISTHEWTITYNCVPARPYQVAEAGERRADSLHSTLNTAINSTQTSVDVLVETGKAAWIDSTAFPTQFPFGITVGGEDMTVTAATVPTAGVQSFTVTRSVNGIVKAHGAGAEVRLSMSERAYVAR